MVVPLLNATVPLIDPPYVPTTSAVKVTIFPAVEGLSDDTSVVDVVVKPMALVALPDVVVALPALAVAVLTRGPAGVPAATCATIVKL